jgi:CubicO group peptidase (beta-lactamase class C family)
LSDPVERWMPGRFPFTGQPFDIALSRRILVPLQLADTSFEVSCHRSHGVVTEAAATPACGSGTVACGRYSARPGDGRCGR